MPEGPEVKVIAVQLHKLLVGQSFSGLEFRGSFPFAPGSKWDRLRERLNDLSRHQGVKITDVDCKGKFLWIEIRAPGSSPAYIGCRLGMTGSWRTTLGPHSHVVLIYGRHNAVYFDDPRRFGSIAILTRSELDAELSELGPDVLTREFTLKRLSQLVKEHRPNMPIATWLLEQSFVAGIGNYLRADILYAARIDPRVPAGKLSPAALRALYAAVKKITKASLKANGTTISSYHDVFLRQGQYDPLVYDKEHDPVGNRVKTTVIAQRTLHWVPSVQTLK